MEWSVQGTLQILYENLPPEHSGENVIMTNVDEGTMSVSMLWQFVRAAAAEFRLYAVSS